MAYFTAVIARCDRAWKARDVDLDDVASLDDLAETLRAVAAADQPVLALVEHEDEWFAIVRVDGDADPKLFVSDLDAATHSHFAELLAPAADVEPELDAEADPAETEAREAEQEPSPSPWAGESDLLEDLGVPGRVLRKLVEERGDDPGTVLAEVGETIGIGDLLEALR